MIETSRKEIPVIMCNCVQNGMFQLPADAKSYQGYIDALYEASKVLPAAAVKDGAEVVTAAMKRDIINAPDAVEASGKVYYISPNGCDSNDGLTPETAWKTAEKLRSSDALLQAGDAVLFERGGEWRKPSEENLKDDMDGATGGASVFVAKKGVYYGAYGTGPKPILNGSPRNYADPQLWEKTEWPGVFRCTCAFQNVGIVALNHSGELGRYDELLAIKEMANFRGFHTPADLRFDCSYYCDVNTQTLYFFSARGINPGERFHSIEIGGRWSMVVDYAAAMIENFHFKFSGYGITGGPVVRVKNCIFSYLGGCKINRKSDDTVVCGNAVEIYGDFEEMTVESCWMYQICDTGMTHQMWRTADSACVHKNVTYCGNVVEYCHWSIEFNNPPADDGSVRYSENITHSYNVLRRGGYGFGSFQFNRSAFATLYNCFGLAKARNVVCEKNILESCSGPLYRMRLEGDRDILFRNNLNIQQKNGKLASLYEVDCPYDEEGIQKLLAESRQEQPLFFFAD